MKKSKLLAVLLVLAMTLSLLPTAAIAAEKAVAKIGDQTFATLTQAISKARDNEIITIIAGGSYTLPAFSEKKLTIKADENVAATIDVANAVALSDAEVTFENLIFDYYPNEDYVGLQHTKSLTYNNCTINGQAFLYATTETFNQCTFNQESSGAYNVWTYGGQNVTFNQCTFNSAGKSVLIYNEGYNGSTVDFVSCTLKASTPVEGKAAIEIDSSLLKDSKTFVVNIDGQTTSTGFAVGSVSGNKLWNEKKNCKSATVTVSGEQVWPMKVAEIVGGGKYETLAAAIDAAKSGDTVKLLKNVTVTNTITIGKNLTINLNENAITGELGDGQNYVFAGRADVEFQNGSITSTKLGLKQDNGTLTLTNVNVTAVERTLAVYDASTVTVGSGSTVKTTGDDATIVIWGDGTGDSAKKPSLNVYGTVQNTYRNDSDGQFAISGNGTDYSGTTINITGDANISANGTAIYHPQGGNLTIEGGTIVGETAIESKAGNTNITVSGNPTITATGDIEHNENNNGNSSSGYAIAVVENKNYAAGAQVSIGSGTYTGPVAILRDNDISDAQKGSISITGGTFTTVPSSDYLASNTIIRKDSDTSFVVMAKTGLTSGTYLSDPSGATAPYYYVTNNNNGTWTVYYSAPSSGGGSSSGGSSNSSTETVKNPDGSTTTTTTNKTTGTVTEVTKEKDGTTTTVETKKDGTVTETVKTPEGVTGTVVTDKNGDLTEAKATVSTTAAKEAAKTGEAVTLPVEVPAVKTTEEAPALQVTVPKSADSVKVEIPVEKVTPGTVAVIVNADGTEKIVSTSVVTENGVALTLDGNATVKIIDNSKSFTDVPADSVFYNEISSLSAREIMVGKTDDKFDLHNSVTLNQIANVAGRITGAVDVKDFNAGVSWGADNGLKTGNQPATRGDVLKALYIAAGSPAVEDTSILSIFNDSSAIPADMAAIAAWAAQNGILKGGLDGNASLGVNVTRGQACALAGRTMGTLD